MIALRDSAIENQRREFRENLFENRSRRGIDEFGAANRPVHALEMITMDSASGLEPSWNLDLEWEFLDLAGDRTNQRQTGDLVIRLGAYNQRGPMTALLAAYSRIEIEPDEIATFGNVGFATILLFRPRHPNPPRRGDYPA